LFVSVGPTSVTITNDGDREPGDCQIELSGGYRLTANGAFQLRPHRQREFFYRDFRRGGHSMIDGKGNVTSDPVWVLWPPDAVPQNEASLRAKRSVSVTCDNFRGTWHQGD